MIKPFVGFSSFLQMKMEYIRLISWQGSFYKSYLYASVIMTFCFMKLFMKVSNVSVICSFLLQHRWAVHPMLVCFIIEGLIRDDKLEARCFELMFLICVSRTFRWNYCGHIYCSSGGRFSSGSSGIFWNLPKEEGEGSDAAFDWIARSCCSKWQRYIFVLFDSRIVLLFISVDDILSVKWKVIHDQKC